MFAVVLYSQWKWSRGAALFATVLAFAVPLMTMRGAQHIATRAGFITHMQSVGVAYAALAAAVGLIVAALAWSHDQRGQHVYALTLPVARWRYVAMRYGAGLLLIGLPVAGLLAGAAAAASSRFVPAGLTAYPIALTVRFGLAAVVAFSIFFALFAASARTARWLVAGLAIVIVADILLGTAGYDPRLVGRLIDAVFGAPGLLSIFGGRWMLIDA